MKATLPQRPWQVVGTDLFEYNDKHYIIMVDYFSNFFEVDSLNSINSKNIILFMKRNFSRYGIPDVVRSDSGTQFTSQEFK